MAVASGCHVIAKPFGLFLAHLFPSSYAPSFFASLNLREQAEKEALAPLEALGAVVCLGATAAMVKTVQVASAQFYKEASKVPCLRNFFDLKVD